MKKKNLLYLLLPFFLFSCEDYLDVSPDMGLSEEEIYSEYYAYRGVLDRAHWYVKDFYPNPHVMKRDYVFGQISDEMQTLKSNWEMNAVNTGNWLLFQTQTWEICVTDFGFTEATSNGNIIQAQSTALSLAKYGMRASNQVLENIDKLKEFPDKSVYTEKELKDQLIGQAYFLRAWFYFEYIRRLGAMPDMRQVFSTSANFDESRPDYQQSTDWLVEDLDSAIALLPDSWDDANGGRPTNISAKALKAMALLYASSPNMNLDYGVASQIDGADAGYNQDYLAKTVTASVEAIKAAEGPTSPYIMYDWGGGDGYEQNFYSKTEKYSREALFHRMPNATPVTQAANTGRGAWRLSYDNGYASYQYAPTHNIVQKFETADGYDVTETGIPSTSFDPKKPYDNRDPRLKMAIFVNGSELYQRPGADNPTLAPYITEGGGDNGYHHWYLREEKALNWTGYEVRGKIRWRGQNNVDQLTGYYRTHPFIRFVQLYLDLAEAANELYGPTGAIPGADPSWDTAEKCINIVRARIDGLSPVRAEYVAAGKIKFRERIRNERAVELFLEFHRWHDIRRWKTAKEDLKAINGVQIIQKLDGSFEYSTFEIPNARTFEEKHYWYPLSLSVEDMMTNFEQNPGW